VLYFGETVKVCLLEAALRDQRDGAIGNLPDGAGGTARYYAELEVAAGLTMADFL
jgi:hypothetical protein